MNTNSLIDSHVGGIFTSLIQFVPAGNLLARATDNFQPVCSLGVARSTADLQMSNHLVLCHLIPVEDHKLEADSRQEVRPCSAGRIGRWKVEDERFVEYWIQGSLLDVRLLLGNALSVVHQVDFHVRV